MEKPEIRDDPMDSSAPLAFESAVVESSVLRKVEYTDFPSPVKDTGELDRVSHRRRPIRLKADLGIAKSDVPDTNKTQKKTARKRNKIGETARGRRPIRLKGDLNSTNRDVPDTNKTQEKTARERKKASKPRTEKKASVANNTRKATPVRHDTPISASSPTKYPSLDTLEPWFSWVKMRRRLLLIVGLSFVSGIVFHSWLGPDESPAPSQVTDSSRGAQQPAAENSNFGTQPVSNNGNASGNYSQTTPANNGYRQEQQSYSDTSYGSTWNQQRPSSQDPNRGWKDFTNQTRPRTPLSSTWRPSAGQPPTDYRNRGRQKYNPWSPRDPQYPPYP